MNLGFIEELKNEEYVQIINALLICIVNERAYWYEIALINNNFVLFLVKWT